MARGLNLHATLAVNPDGVPLGVLRAAFDAPPPPDPEAKGRKPLEQRKSFRWIEGLRDCAEATAPLDDTRAVCVMDREADFLDLFIEQHDQTPTVDLLVRAKTNRVLGHDTDGNGEKVVRHLFDELRSAPARGQCHVEVRRLSARNKASKQAQSSAICGARAELANELAARLITISGMDPQRRGYAFEKFLKDLSGANSYSTPQNGLNWNSHATGRPALSTCQMGAPRPSARLS